MSRKLCLLAGLLCLWAPVFARQEQAICGTNRDKLREELYLHRQGERTRLMRRSLGLRAAEPAYAARDAGNIAILSDGNGVVGRRNDFNLVYQTLIFRPTTPQASAYRFNVRENTYDSVAATAGIPITLGDDDSQSIALPFPFRFFGVSYDRVFLNSDGNLTFGAADPDSSDRSLGRLTAGPPRVAALFRDLDPAKASQGVRVLSQGDRFVVSWVSVPEYSDLGSGSKQTFQARLYPDGRIEFAYYDINTASAVVGIAPGNLKGTPSVVSFSSGSAVEYSAAVAEVFRDTTEVDVVTTAQKFYETHDDAYDYLVIFNNLGIAAGDSAVAYESTVRNSRTGYGDIPVDAGSQFGSAYRLQAVQNMGPLSQYPVDPNGIVTARRTSRDTPLTVIAHEAGHLFLAYASVRDESDPEARPMLGYQNAHWTFAFNSEASLLEGNRIRDNGPSASPRFITTGTVEGYSPLDQYLMGFRSTDEVLPTFLVNGTSTRYRPPESGAGLDGSRRDIQLQEIIDVEGRRTPDSTVAQRHFRFAFILITAGGADPSAAELARLESYRAGFETYYSKASSNRARADATLKRGLRLSVFPAAGVLEGGTAPASITLQRPAAAATTVFLKTQTGVADMPASVTIPAGASSAAFEIRGLRAGVEELTAEPADSSYETAYARIQVLNGAAGVRVTAEASSGTVLARVTDINNLPYPGVTVRGNSGAGAHQASTDAAGVATFPWDGQNQFTVSADGVVGGFVLGPARLPVFTAGAVVNAASGAPGLSPGGLASIYGANLAGGATLAGPYPWPDVLSGVRVVVGGLAAPLLYVSDGQINFLVPELLPVGPAGLAVTTPAGNSAAVNVAVNRVSPGIFAVVIAGTRQTPVEHPARRGDYLEIYCTGLGPVAPVTSVYRETTVQPEVRIGPVSAPVTYSGLAPGFLGLYQVNVVVPQGVTSGAQTLTLVVNQASSNTVPVTIE